LQSITTSYTAPLTVAWSPDGRYLAVSYTTGSRLQIFAFNGTTAIPGFAVSTGAAARDVAWSPDGKYLSVGIASTPGSLQVYLFSYPAAPTLIGAATSGATTWQTAWSPDGKFIAVVNNDGGTLQFSDSMEIAQFH